MRHRRIGLVSAMVTIMMIAAAAPTMAHDTGEFGERPEASKGRSFDVELDGHISPGGVPLEPLSDIRCEDGMAGIFPCHKVDLASFTPLTGIDASFVSDVWGWTDPVTGMQLAIVGTFEGAAFIDVTDGAAPVYLGTLPSAFPATFRNIWYDVRVYRDYAYIGSEAAAVDPDTGEVDGFGMQIVDLTQFRGATGPIDVALANRVTDFTQSHNLSLNEDSGRLYVVGAFAGLDVCRLGPPPFRGGSGAPIAYDVSNDPVNPEFLGCLFGDEYQYSHDIQCVTYSGPDTRYTGNEICFSSNEAALVLYDATDPTNPEVLAEVKYLDLPFFDEDRGVPNYYTHQGWLSEDQRYFFLGDELDEFFGPAEERTTYLWDMADLENPELIGVHTDGNTSIDHNMFVSGNLLYQSNYTSGLWIYDTWKIDQGRITSRGYFDVFPADDRTDFFGTWGNYPFFGDGKVVVTSSDEGVFVVQSRAKSAADNLGRGPK